MKPLGQNPKFEQPTSLEAVPAEKIEKRRGVPRMGVDVRERILEAQTEKWIGALTEKMQKKLPEQVPGAHLQFRKEFQEAYLKQKFKLADLWLAAKDFLKTKPDFAEQEILEKLPLSQFNVEERQEIKNTVKQRIQRSLDLKEMLSSLNNEPNKIFEHLANAKPFDDVESKREGDVLIMNVSEKDFANLYCSGLQGKERRFCEQVLPDGFYRFVETTKPKSKKEISFGLNVVKSQLEKGDRDKLNELYFEDMQKEWEDETGEEWGTEEAEEKFNSWLDEKEAREDNFQKWFSEFAESGEIDELGDLDFASRLRRWAETLRHEKHHALDRLLFIHDKNRRLPLRNQREVMNLLKLEYRNYLDDLRDEIIAFAEEAPEGSEELKIVAVGKEPAFEFEKEEFGEEEAEEEERREMDRGEFFRFYNYAEEYGPHLLSDIKEKIGERNFRKWQVKKFFNEQIRDRFRDKIQKFAKIGLYIQKSQDRERLTSLFEIEPGKNWERLYRWLQNNPDSRNRFLGTTETSKKETGLGSH